MKRITIKDLAALLQINPSTVSRALSDHPDISDAVKKKVKETAELLNYVPNDFAVNFRKKSSKVIGLIIPQMSTFFIPAIMKGVASRLALEGYNFFILSSEDSLEKEIENLKTCANSRVDGVLISLTSETKSTEHLRKLDTLEIPVVIFDKILPQGQYDLVVFDNEERIRLCVKRLTEANCRNVVAILGSENLEMTTQRNKIFMQQIKQYPDIRCKTIFCSSPDAVSEKLGIMLDYEMFDGYFVMSDELLTGLSYTLKSKKINENECTVAAISEGFLPHFLNPDYTFETNDGYKMGIMATNVLLGRISKSETSELPAAAQIYYI